MQPIMKICYAIVLAWRRRKSSYHHILTNHPLSHKVTRAYHTFWLTNAYYFWPSSHPSAWLCKFYYQAYRWIFFYYFHTLSSSQTYATMPHDAENFRHVLHRCIAPWQKIPFLVYNQSTITIHSSYVMRPHQNYHILLTRTNYHCFLVLYFLHQFVEPSFIILKFLLWTYSHSVHKL